MPLEPPEPVSGHPSGMRDGTHELGFILFGLVYLREYVPTMMITFSWKGSFAVSGRNSVMGTAELGAGSGSIGAIIVDKYTRRTMARYDWFTIGY